VTGTWGTHRTEIRRVSPQNGMVTRYEPPLMCGDESADGAVAVSADGRVIAHQYQEDRGDVWLLEAPPGSF